jgi:AraC-like DNA-binding protein
MKYPHRIPILQALGKELTVSRLAEEVSLSPFYFARQFKEATGKSPHQFVVEARVAKAKQLLETRNITIGEAAYEVGFVDQSHRTRHFKHVFGMPPIRIVVSTSAGLSNRLCNPPPRNESHRDAFPA